MKFLSGIPLVLILLLIVGGLTVGNALAVTFGSNVVSSRVGTDSLIKAESNGGSAIFRMNDVGTKIFDIQVLDGKDRLDFVDRTLGQLRLTIASDGNVGIGTALPQEKLDVRGDIRLTGDIVSPNDICMGTCP